MVQITVIGSINLDTILQIPRLPKPGETLAMFDQSSAGGGKGANQAIAAARAGAETYFIGKIGQDEAAEFMLDQMQASQIDTKGIIQTKQAGTGQAYILLDQVGENSILLYPGANEIVTEENVLNSAPQIKGADFVIGQLESNISATTVAFRLAKENQVKTILNPAPAKEKLSSDLLKNTDLIVPNETECELITGVKITDEASMIQAAEKMFALGPQVVIITLGSRGAFYHTQKISGFVPAFKVAAVDTTAAGDTFIGALSSQLKTDFSNLADAIQFGNLASSLTVQQLGAQPSIPNLAQIQEAKEKKD